MGTKFKVGDRVTVTKADRHGHLRVGMEGTVVRFKYDMPEHPCVRFPGFLKGHDGNGGISRDTEHWYFHQDFDGEVAVVLEDPKEPLATQVGGSHYTRMAIQPLEFIMANDIPYPEANIIKYVCRHRHKNGIQDLKKAQDYLNKLIAHEESKGTP